MKKAFAISFLLIANMILLAHAVIPHHYHHQIPDITWSFLCENGNSHTANQCTDPDCPAHGVVEDCFLKKIGVRFNNNGQLKSSIDTDFKLLPCLLSLFAVTPIIEIDNLESLPFHQKPHLLSHHTDFISHSFGLRAPPAIMN